MEAASSMTVPGVIVRSRRQVEEDDFTTALDTLVRETNTSDSGDILVEIVRVNIVRGDRVSAAQTLEGHGSSESQMLGASPYSDILSLQSAYIGVSERGELDTAVRKANLLWEKHQLGSVDSLETGDEAVVSRVATRMVSSVADLT